MAVPPGLMVVPQRFVLPFSELLAAVVLMTIKNVEANPNRTSRHPNSLINCHHRINS